MQKDLSNDLITISSMLLMAQERGEVIRLAGELNSVIQKAMELEQAKNDNSNDKRKTSSATIKFTLKEIDKMSKTFKKEFIANGCVAHIIKRPSGKKGYYYEIRYRRNGYNITVSNTDLPTAKKLFIEATKNLEAPNLNKRSSPTFESIAHELIEYKKDKVNLHTWKSYIRRTEKLDKAILSKPIKEIRTIDIDRFMHTYDNEPRQYEEMRTLINSVFTYALASGIISHNPVTLIPFKRANRVNRGALTDFQIKEFLTRIKEPKYDCIRQYAYALYFFGLRPCEPDKDSHFENGFLICRNRKRKKGVVEYKKIPVPKQAQGLIDFDKPIYSPYTYSYTLEFFKEALGNELTPYNLRHTFASKCAEAVRQDIVEIWMGDSPERLVGKTYVHFNDEFMKAQMDKVEFIII